MRKPNETPQSISVRVTKEFYEEISNRAKQCNMTVSEYARQSLSKSTVYYYSNSPELIREACALSTQINLMKHNYPDINFEKVEKGVYNICALLLS